MTTAGGEAAIAPCVDLQVHSTASDGALPPADVVRAAAAAGLSAIALTDHDTTAGVAEAVAQGAVLGVRIVAGVELSAHWREHELHLLGLHVAQVDVLEARLADFRVAREARAEAIVARLATLGVPVTMEAVHAHAGGASLGRPHVARALVAAGHCRDFREAFDRWLGAGRPAFVEKRRLSLEDALALLRDVGALACWAHPGKLGTEAFIRPLVEAGLEAVEVRHPSHSLDDRARIAALAERYGLLASGGSDWHGQMDGPRVIGNQQVPLAWLEAQDRRVAERRPAEAVP